MPRKSTVQLMREDCKRAEKEARKAESKSVSQKTLKNKWKEAANLYNALAAALKEKEEFEDALDAHFSELEASEKCESVLDQVIAKRNIGETYYNLNNHEEGERHLLRSIELARDVEEEGSRNKYQQLAYHVLGSLYENWAIVSEENREKLQKALACFENSKRILEAERGSLTCDQKSRLGGVLQNLATVCFHLNRYDEWINHSTQAEKLAKETKDDQLLQYVFYARGCERFAVGDLISDGQLEAELSLKLARKRNDKRYQAESLILWGHILVNQKNFMEAGKKFLECYKLREPEDQSMDDSKTKMKLAYELNDYQQKLNNSAVDDRAVRRDLFEKMADILSSRLTSSVALLKHCKLAVEYYEHMLEESISAGLEDKDLIPCYISIAETHKDANDHERALENFVKAQSCGIEDENLKVSVALDIAIQAEKSGKRFEVVFTYYKTAAQLADITNDSKKKVGKQVKYKAYSNLKWFLDKNQPVEEVENNYSSDVDRKCAELRRVASVDSDSVAGSEGGWDSEPLTDEVIAELESDDEEVPKVGSRSGAKKPPMNELGETKLHKAAINGDANEARRFVKQKELVNMQDKFGFTPLHEAANHGNVEVAEILINNGANVDAFGNAEEATPLIDAAGAGSVSVMSLLIKNKAQIHMKNSFGYTAADELDYFLYKNSLCPEASERLTPEERKVALDMVRCLDKALQGKIRTRPRDWPKRQREDQEGDLRGNKLKERQAGYGKKAYREAIACVGRKHRHQIASSDSELDEDTTVTGEDSKSFHSRATAFVTDEEFQRSRDWLVNDILQENQVVRRRTGQFDGFATRHLPLERRRRSASIGTEDTPGDAYQESFTVDNPNAGNSSTPLPFLPENSSDSVEEGNGFADFTSANNIREQVVNLLSDREDSSDDEIVLPSQRRSPVRKRQRQSKLSQIVSREIVRKRPKVNVVPLDTSTNSSAMNRSFDFEPLASLHPQNLVGSPDNASEQLQPTTSRNVGRSIVVKFSDSQKIKVPVKDEDSVKCLINKAVERFSRLYSKQNVPADVRLQADGCDLAEQDQISDVLPDQSEVSAIIDSWMPKPLDELYAQICEKERSVVFANVKRKLARAAHEQKLDLEGLGLIYEKVRPVLKALQFSYNIKLLSLKSVTLNSDAVCELGTALKHLSCLETLILERTGLSDYDMQLLATCLDGKHLALKKLVLSWNSFGDNSCRALGKIFRVAPLLEKVWLRKTDLTKNFFRDDELPVFSNLKQLKELDIAKNRLECEGIEKLLNQLPRQTVKVLDLADTVHSVGEKMELEFCELLRKFSSQKDCAMERLNLSGIQFGGHLAAISGPFLECCANMRQLAHLGLAATKFNSESVETVISARNHP